MERGGKEGHAGNEDAHGAKHMQVCKDQISHLKLEAPGMVWAILLLCMPGKLSSFRMLKAPSTAPGRGRAKGFLVFGGDTSCKKGEVVCKGKKA